MGVAPRLVFVWISAVSTGSLCGCEVTRSAHADEAKVAAPGAAIANADATGARESDAEDAPFAPQTGAPLARSPGIDARAVPVSSAGQPAPRCPDEMTLVGDSCVDRYEAYLVQARSDGSFQRHPEYERPEPGVRYEARSKAGIRPQAYISSVEAAAACENAGKRLCSLAEWTQACRGPEDTTFPYGNEFERGKCNTRHKHILAEVHGKNPMLWTYDDFNDPELIKRGSLAEAGKFDECTNAYGTFDMVGNLHEWTADRVDRTLPSKVPLPKNIRRTVARKHGYGIFMGGFFSTYAQHGQGCEFITIAHEPRYHDYSTGFRCCKSAEP
jgi:formylglycine-generating enzyme required for sulfatase activity